MGDKMGSEIVPLSGIFDASLESIVPLPVPASMAEAFAEFLDIDVADGDATPDTVNSYLGTVALFLGWCAAQDIAPENISRRHIEAYRADLKARGNAVATRSRKLSIVRRFYEAALKHGLVRENPALRVRGGKDLTPPEEKIKALTRAALSDLLRSIPSNTLLGRRDRVIVALMAVHGLRRVEVHRLDHESLDVSGETASLLVVGKGGRVRRIFLREDTFASVTGYIAAKLEAGLPLSGPLLISGSNNSQGARISRRGLNWVVDSYLNALNLKKDGVSCHSLRHTHGTLAVAGGAKVEQLRDAMGHSRLETTSIYVKAVERVKHNPANFIDVDV